MRNWLYFLLSEGVIEYICDRCGEKCDSNRHLISHMRKHTHPKSTECHICGKVYENFRFFSLSLSLSRKYLFFKPTTKCSFHFHQNLLYHRLKKWGNMKAHMQLHTNTKPHRCTLCDKSYHYRGGLEIHMATHTGVMPYNCQYCGKNFSQKGVLTVSPILICIGRTQLFPSKF